MLGTGVILGEQYLLAADDVGYGKSARQVENSFKAVGDTGLHALLYDDTVNDYLDIMLFVLVQLYLLGQLIHYAVHTRTDKARLSCAFQLLVILSLAVPYNGSQKLELSALRQLHKGIHHLVDGLL